MSNDLEPLVLKITGSANGLSAAIGRAEADLKRFTAQARAQQSEIASMPSLTSLLIGGGAGAATLGAFKLASQAEQAAVSFEVLTGSVAESQKMIQQLRELGASTPLNFTGLQENAKVMLGFGIAVGDVLPNIRALGDISGGNTEKMKLLTLAFSQSAAAGRLMGQDVLQMINAGFNPLQEISKNTGRTMVQLKADMEAGAISFDMVREAFMSATSEGGRFNNMLERQADTLAGTTGIAIDKTQQLAASMAAVFAPAVKDAVVQLTAMLDYLSSFNAESLRTAANVAAGAAAFASVVVIAPRVISAVQGISKALAWMQAMMGPKGLISLGVGLAAAASAVYYMDSAFEKYQTTLAETTRESIEANGANNALAASAKAVTGAITEQAKAFEKLAANGLSSGTADNAAEKIAKLKAELKFTESSAARLNAELARAGKVDGYNKIVLDMQKAQKVVDDLLAKSKASENGQFFFNGLFVTDSDVKRHQENVEHVKTALAQMARLKAELGGDTTGRGADAINKDLDATKKVIADLSAELGSLDGSLTKNKEHWEAQAASIRKSFESPIDIAKSQMASLAESVKQGGLEMEVYVQAAAKIKDEFNKASDAKKELAKPVQFAGAVMRGSAADIQDRFRYMTSPANQQQTKLQEEGNRLLNSMDESMKKISAKLFSNPVAKIA